MSAMGSMHGKVVLITGGTGGIGMATATGIAKLGATVVVVGHDKGRGEAAVAEIQDNSGNLSVELMLADLSSQVEIRNLAKDFTIRHDRLHVLINNVGGLYAKRWQTKEGIEATLAVNYLCPFLLTHLLIPTLQASAPSRIVNITSLAHKFAKLNFDDLQATQLYSGTKAYTQAKLAIVMFTYELAKRFDGMGITVNATYPGEADTQMTRSEALRFFLRNMHRLTRQIRRFNPEFMTTEKASQSSIYLASSPELEDVTGKYFSRKKKMVTSSKASYEEVAARRLWQISTGLTGLTETTPTA